MLMHALKPNRATTVAVVVPFQLSGGWWTWPSGFWIRHGECVPRHAGQDVEFGRYVSFENDYEWRHYEEQHATVSEVPRSIERRR